MGSFDWADDTEGRVLRPRDPFEFGVPGGFSVDAEEVLADDECLLSAGRGDSVLEAIGPSSHIESSLKCGPMSSVYFLHRRIEKQMDIQAEQSGGGIRWEKQGRGQADIRMEGGQGCRRR